MTYLNKPNTIDKEEFKTITLENTAKLLAKCAKFLQTRRLAYKTLKLILIFERLSYQIRSDVDLFVDQLTPSQELKEKIYSETVIDL